MFQSKILDLSNCNACQVQSVSDKFKTVCIKSKTCPMLRIEISFKVFSARSFQIKLYFVSSSSKTKIESRNLSSSIHNSNNKTIHHFSMRPKHHEQSKQLDSHCRKQFLPNPHQSNQHVSECSDTVQSPWPIDQRINLLLLVNFNTFPTGSPSLAIEPVEHKCTAATCLC